jgi:nucleotidyltransferase substrate binding protein (TIGR01987 family)
MNTSDLDIRWKQRLTNLTRAKNMLDGIKDQKLEDMDYVDIAGWIHIFDLVFELSWKTLRDYMLAQWESESLNFTREVLQIAIARGFISDGDVWIDMLADRNSSTHEYDEKNAQAVVKNIQLQYLWEIQDLYAKFIKLT